MSTYEIFLKACCLKQMPKDLDGLLKAAFNFAAKYELDCGLELGQEVDSYCFWLQDFKNNWVITYEAYELTTPILVSIAEAYTNYINSQKVVNLNEWRKVNAR